MCNKTETGAYPPHPKETLAISLSIPIIVYTTAIKSTCVCVLSILILYYYDICDFNMILCRNCSNR